MQTIARSVLPFALAFLASNAFAQESGATDASAGEAQGASNQAEAPQSKGASPLESLHWTVGPSTAPMESIAKLEIPDGYRFIAGDDTRTLLSAMQNVPSHREVGLVAPNDLAKWFAVFEFDDSGYVDDSEKTSLDANAILRSLKEGNDAANEERKQRGWSTIEILGWQIAPHYDDATHNLEWATKAKSSDGVTSINVNTRILGRRGVMRVTLVCGPEVLDSALAEYKQTLGGFDYQSGQRYAEYRSGDKLATYGLTALVAGGAGVLAAKTGLLAKFWKLIVGGAIALIGGAKRLFGLGKKSAPATEIKP